jgi:predicted lipid-binding transport protein (Tim44 family)
MKNALFTAALSIAVVMASAPDVSEAKRVGGGRDVGMQRQAPAQAAPQTPPSQMPAAAPTAAVAGKPAAAAAATAAAAPAKRSWLGPIAGLAAGLGLAALFSAMGLGEGFANFVMLLLLGIAVFFVVRLVLARMRGGAAQPAMAGAGAAGSTASAPAWPQAQPEAMQRGTLDTPSAATGGAAPESASVTGSPLRPIQIGEGLAAPAAVAAPEAAPALPEGFDLPAFERIAKMIFIRLQAANDSGNLDDLREFTTPEVFADLRLDIQERGASGQHTDVERIEARLVEFVQEPGRQVASVRFTGEVREERDAPAVAVDEVWHLVKPTDGSRGWAIAGIQQTR